MNQIALYVFECLFCDVDSAAVLWQHLISIASKSRVCRRTVNGTFLKSKLVLNKNGLYLHSHLVHCPPEVVVVHVGKRVPHWWESPLEWI